MIFTIANGKKIPSLGESRIMIEIDEGIEIPITVQVIDSIKEDLLLGTAFLVKTKGIIDFEEGKLTLKYDGEHFELPISYIRDEEDENSDSEWEEFEEEKEFQEDEYDQYEETEDELEIYMAIQSLEETSRNNEFDKNLKVGTLEQEQEKIFKGLLLNYGELCALSTTKLGKTGIIKHKIDTGEHEPIAGKPYKTDDNKKKIIKEEIEKMEKAGIIRKSYSPWASPVVIIDKKDGSKRFCIDFRKVNDITKTDAHPLPRIDDLLKQFRTARYFSSMDLASGYWQVEMDEKDKEKTAFTCHLGLYEFNVMPFGLKNAPATFQRLMNHVLREYLYELAVVYIDDILIYSKTFEEHMEYVEKIFRKLKEEGLMIKLKKCKFCEPNIEFLGHVQLKLVITNLYIPKSGYTELKLPEPNFNNYLRWI